MRLVLALVAAVGCGPSEREPPPACEFQADVNGATFHLLAYEDGRGSDCLYGSGAGGLVFTIPVQNPVITATIPFRPLGMKSQVPDAVIELTSGAGACSTWLPASSLVWMENNEAMMRVSLDYACESGLKLRATIAAQAF